MFHRALQAGVDMRRNAGVERLVTDDAGRVCGVVARIDGKERTIGARRGVLVNAGGFAHNQEMRDKYQPGTSAKWTATNPGDTGEMILEMMRHGAAVAQMEEMVGNQAAFPPENADGIALVVSEIAKPNSLVVDQSGERYINENQSYMSFCQGMLERNKTVPAVPSWLVFDSAYMRKYMVTGTLPGTRKPMSWFEQGWLMKADTIEQLAGLCAIEPGKLRATVDRFNMLRAERQGRGFRPRRQRLQPLSRRQGQFARRPRWARSRRGRSMPTSSIPAMSALTAGWSPIPRPACCARTER